MLSDKETLLAGVLLYLFPLNVNIVLGGLYYLYVLNQGPPRNPNSYKYFKFKSTKECSGDISQALKGRECHVIGLYGKKGSGKSALLQSELKEYRKTFGRVFYYECGINPKKQYIKSIREQIAKELHDHFKTHPSSAFKKCTMKNSKPVYEGGPTLVILDGFPEKFKLGGLGFAHKEGGSYHLRPYCKALLTASNRVDCKSMGCDHFIPMKHLNDDEAIELIKYISGFTDGSPLSKVARKIAPKCKGSPGLITDVVSSLVNETVELLEKWEALSVILDHPNDDYQIFLNFRGPNTRETFASHLCQELRSNGFITFFDVDSLKNGNDIYKLLDYIGKSRCAIVILSEDYADSKWCLRELAKIMDCREKKNQLVLPIFYGVKPTDVEHLRGKYGTAMAKHEKDPNTAKEVPEWKLALEKIPNVVGEPYIVPSPDQRDEFIKKMVNVVHDQRYRLHLQSMYGN